MLKDIRRNVSVTMGSSQSQQKSHAFKNFCDEGKTHSSESKVAILARKINPTTQQLTEDTDGKAVTLNSDIQKATFNVDTRQCSIGAVPTTNRFLCDNSRLCSQMISLEDNFTKLLCPCQVTVCITTETVEITVLPYSYCTTLPIPTKIQLPDEQDGWCIAVATQESTDKNTVTVKSTTTTGDKSPVNNRNRKRKRK